MAAFLDSKAAQSTIKDSAIQSYLTTLFTSGSLAPSNNTIYGVYFPAASGFTATYPGPGCVVPNK